MKLTKRSVVVVIVALAAVLALIGAASAQGPVTNQFLPAVAKGNWSALDKVDALLDSLDKAGFDWQAGTVKYIDWVWETCQGNIFDTLANNPWPTAYVSFVLPPLQGSAKPPLDWSWQLGEDEAIVMVGQTPPAAAYFSYQSFLALMPDNPETPVDESKQRLGIAVGDTVNIGTIHTIGPDRVNRPMVYIITGHRETERRVRAAVRAAGYPDAIINVETVSPTLGPLGVNGAWFFFAHRVAVPADPAALQKYLQNPPYKIFRVTPKTPLPADPEPAPVLRVRGTGHTEMDLYPSLKALRKAILAEYEAQGYTGTLRKELDTKVWSLVTKLDGREMILEKPWVGLQRGIQVIGATRDTNYLATYPNFKLREDPGEFVIVYGVNHQKTGKVTYSSFSIYADKYRWFGLKNGTTFSPNYGDSAKKYLCPDEQHCDPNWPDFYAWKVARNCGGEEYCMDARVNDDPAKPFTDIYDEPYACVIDNPDTSEIDPTPFDLNTAEMFFLWRSYMEPATKVSPDDNELLYDRAIYFGPYFAQQ